MKNEDKDQDASLLDARTQGLIAEMERMEPLTRALALRTKVNMLKCLSRAGTTPALRVTTHVFPISPGKPGAPIGTREWADYLRISLVSMVDHIGEEDDQVLTTIEFTKKHRAWTLMNKPDGSFFKSIEEFCAFRRPYGLGKSWRDLRPFFLAALAKRGTPADEAERRLQLEAAPELGTETPTAVDCVVSAIEQLAPEQRAEVFRRVEHLRAAPTP